MLEIEEKIQLYLAKGANEVRTCDNEGSIHYFSHSGQLGKSGKINSAASLKFSF